MNKSQMRYKGKFISEKQYKKRMQTIENTKIIKKNKDEVNVSKPRECIVKGRRIVNLKVMADHLHCSSCKEDLSLLDIENETRTGLASIFTVRCRECLALTSVPTDKMDQGATGEQRALINEQAVSGAIKAGLDYTSFNHFLSILEIPNMTEEIFKNFEREIRPIVENAHNDGSAQANKEEMVKSEAGE